MNSSMNLWRICVIAALFPLAFGLYTLLEPFGRDQGIHATIAFALQEGLPTYSEVYNIKPPLTTATHWLALELFGHSYHSIRVFDLIFVCAGMAGFAAAILRLGGSTALALGTPLGFTAIFYPMSYWVHAQTDEWAALWIVFSVLAMAGAWRRPPGRERFGLICLAGAMMGAAFFYKYTVGTIGLLVFAPLMVPRGDVRFFWRDLLWLVIGGLSLVGLVVAVLAASGTLNSFLEIQNYIRGYLDYSKTVLTILRDSIRLIYVSSVGNSLLLAFGIFAFLLSALRNWSLLHAVTLILAVSGMISAVAQGKGISYHYLPFFLATAIAMGYAVELAYRTVAQRLTANSARRLFAVAIFLVVGFVSGALTVNLRLGTMVATGKLTPHDFAMAYVNDTDYSFADMLAFSEQFSEIREEDETFFLWGYETGLYFLQGVPPLYRYPYSWPFSVSFHDGRYSEDLLSRLDTNPPDYVVLQKMDATPWVTANPKDSKSVLPDYPEIHAFVTDGYQPVLETKRFDLWKRNP